MSKRAFYVLLAVLGALGAYGFWLKRKKTAVMAGQGLGGANASLPSPSGSITPNVLSPVKPQPAFVDTDKAAAENLAAKAGNAILPGAGIVTGAIAGTYVDAAKDVLSGSPSVASVAEIAFFPVAVTATAINALIDVFGLRGKPLDPVAHVLLGPLANPPRTDDNYQSSEIYALDSTGVKHSIGRFGSNDYGFSGRDVIAVARWRLESWPTGAPLPDPIPPEAYRATADGKDGAYGYNFRGFRPPDAETIREFFGFDAVFKLGNSNDLHGPWEIGLGTVAPIIVPQNVSVAPIAVAVYAPGNQNPVATIVQVVGTPISMSEAETYRMAGQWSWQPGQIAYLKATKGYTSDGYYLGSNAPYDAKYGAGGYLGAR
jgi:hypothetical protein